MVDSMAYEKKESDDPKTRHSTITEHRITIKELDDTKTPGKYNPKLSVFREFALATAHTYAEEHATKQSCQGGSEDGKRQFYACDLIAQSGIAGLQWKRHLGNKVHVTVVEQRDPQPLRDNIQDNGFSVLPLPLDPSRPAGTLLLEQSSSELHLAQCDGTVLMHLESFDFVYVDPHKNPAPYFGSIFRNIRSSGVVCFVVPDTMQFARSPHVIRRCYGAHCMKTEYLKELAVRIILATLAAEAAKCNKGMTVLYSVSLENCLLLAVQVVRGPKLADDMLQQNIGHVLHCRICEERTFYPVAVAPVEDPYSLISCDCQKNVPGKTGVILGPLWKGSIFEYGCLTRLAVSGKALGLTPAFFTLLQRVMEDCLCDTPPTLQSLQQGLPQFASDERPLAGNGDVPLTDPQSNTSSALCDNGKESGSDGHTNGKTQELKTTADDGCVGGNGPEDKYTDSASSNEINTLSTEDCKSQSDDSKSVTDKLSSSASIGESRGVKRLASEAYAGALVLPQKRSKVADEPMPCFFYNMHSKRIGTNHLPKHQAVIERLRANGHRSCRTHFEKYAIRTSADLKTLTSMLGTSENKVLYVKGGQTV